MTFEELFLSLSWKWKIIVSLVILLPIVGMGTVVFNGWQDNNRAYEAWATDHNVPPCPASNYQNCDDRNLTVKHNATVTFVRDYQVECDTWFNRATCPKENVSFQTQNNLNQTLTLSCQFYKVGDKIVADERFGWHDFQNPTDNWSIEGSPC